MIGSLKKRNIITNLNIPGKNKLAALLSPRAKVMVWLAFDAKSLISQSMRVRSRNELWRQMGSKVHHNIMLRGISSWGSFALRSPDFVNIVLITPAWSYISINSLRLLAQLFTKACMLFIGSSTQGNDAPILFIKVELDVSSTVSNSRSPRFTQQWQ